MNFIKTFIISLVIYLGLNTVFTLIAVFTSGITDIILIITMIFAPIITFPGAAWSTEGIVPLLTSADFFTDFMLFLGLIVPPLVTIIVASFLGDTNNTVFGAWILTALVTCIVYFVLLMIGQSVSDYIVSYGKLGGILVIFTAGIANGLFYGGVAYIITKEGL